MAMQVPLQLLYTDARLHALTQQLDELHTAASDGLLQRVTPLSNAELVGWLRDVLYTVQETIVEIEQHGNEPAGLRRVK